MAACWAGAGAGADAGGCACCGAADPPELVVLRARRRDHLLRVLDAATALKTRLESELAAPDAGAGGGGGGGAGLPGARLQLAAGQARLDELVARAPAPLDAAAVRRALQGSAPPAPPRHHPPPEPALLLANHCLAALHARGCWPARLANGGGCLSPPAPAAASPQSPLRSPLPRCYLDVAVEGAAWGRVVLELRADAAPRMCRNFLALCCGEAGAGAGTYRGCSVFQCWAAESVIAGDWELNNGRGGRGAGQAHFAPDDSRLPCVRGAVGMRREQKRHDSLGLVGSQFRIVLREMRGFTGIFARVLDGLELVDRLSRAGDSAGKPHAHITIADCGRLD